MPSKTFLSSLFCTPYFTSARFLNSSAIHSKSHALKRNYEKPIFFYCTNYRLSTLFIYQITLRSTPWTSNVYMISKYVVVTIVVIFNRLAMFYGSQMLNNWFGLILLILASTLLIAKILKILFSTPTHFSTTATDRTWTGELELGKLARYHCATPLTAELILLQL